MTVTAIKISEKLAHTTEETVALMGVSTKAVRKWIHEGRPAAGKIGSMRYLIPKEASIRFLNGQGGS